MRDPEAIRRTMERLSEENLRRILKGGTDDGTHPKETPGVGTVLPKRKFCRSGQTMGKEDNIDVRNEGNGRRPDSRRTGGS